MTADDGVLHPEPESFPEGIARKGREASGAVSTGGPANIAHVDRRTPSPLPGEHRPGLDEERNLHAELVNADRPRSAVRPRNVWCDMLHPLRAHGMVDEIDALFWCGIALAVLAPWLVLTIAFGLWGQVVGFALTVLAGFGVRRLWKRTLR